MNNKRSSSFLLTILKVGHGRYENRLKVIRQKSVSLTDEKLNPFLVK